MKKAVKAGIIGAGVLGYSIIPTYLMKYHWIIRDKKMAKKEEKVLYLTFDDGPDTVYTNKFTGSSGSGTGSGNLFHGSGSCTGTSGYCETDEKKWIFDRNTFFESSKCNAVRTWKDRKGSERIQEDYGENGN